jgi:tetratricopeptide (TPR) repeat protein
LPPNGNKNTETQNKVELGEEKSSLGLPDLFSDFEMDSTAYRAVGELFFHYKHYKPADIMCNKAYSSFHSGDNTAEKFKISILHSKVLLKLHNKDKAFETILECVKDIDAANIPASLKRLALLAKANVETKLGMREAAVESYTQAKVMDPTGMTPGESLVKELGLFEKVSDYAGYFRTLKSWSSIDRLTWMAWNYCNDGRERHSKLRSLAIKEGETEFLIEAYKNAIQFLDRLNAGAPLRLELAMAYFRAAGDVENSRKCLDEIFESTSGGYPYAITDEEPQYILQRSVDAMSDVLYETFRGSRDPAVKAEALTALKGLMDRPLSLAVPIYTSLDLVYRRIIIASMCLKMGQGSEFQERLQSILDDCFAGLSDKVSWNDGQNLEKLGHSLMILSKSIPQGQDIQRYARIVMSAMFSKITPPTEEEAASDSDSDSDSDSGSDSDSSSENESVDGDDKNGKDDAKLKGGLAVFEGISAFETMAGIRSGKKSAPGNEGDLGNPEVVLYTCDGGICNPRAGYAWWGDSVVHYCAECSTTLICEICYNARHHPEKVGSPNVMNFCDNGHNYIKLPVEGWRGIKDGMMRLDGEEPVKFDDFLKHLI